MVLTRRAWHDGDWINCPRCERQTCDVGACSLCGNLGVLDMGALCDHVPIAALYVTKGGVYYGLEGVDPWDEERDARNYMGPHPIVAHPPCNRWSRLSAGRLRGQDGGCFKAALVDVRRFGGVLEHPAYSQAWCAFGLPKPIGPHWTRQIDDPGWVCSIDQWLYGYPARKPTWLYYVGPTPPALPDRKTLSTRSCADVWSVKRSNTPPAFAELLVALARTSYVTSEAAA